MLEALRRGVNDPSAAVRDRTLRGINSLPALWAGKSSTKLLLSALADDEPALRRRGLTLASTKPGFWTRPDTQEHLKRLLVDPDPQVRLLALSTVEQHGLIRHEPSLARRVKALASDPALKTRALNLLTAHDLDPATIKADVPLSRPRLLELFDLPAQGQPGLLSSRRRQACLRELPRQPHDPPHRRGRCRQWIQR